MLSELSLWASQYYETEMQQKAYILLIQTVIENPEINEKNATCWKSEDI